MAGWRRVSDGGDEPGEAVELVDDSDHAVAHDGRALDWHAALRTAAAVVVALAVLWAGRSLAVQADADRFQQCIADVERAYWRYEQQSYGPNGTPRSDEVFTSEVVDGLIDDARRCGATAYADALDRTRPTVDEDR